VRYLESAECDVILPLCDYTTIALSKYQERLRAHVNFAVPPYEALLAGHNKLRVQRLASGLGIATPATYWPRSREEVREVADEVRYPCVVKPRKGAGGIGVRYAHSAEELMGMCVNGRGGKDVVHDFRRPMVQEYIPGAVHDVCVLFNRGRCVAALTQKRVKMYPISGGRGAVNETTDEPELRETAIRLLESLVWHGPAMVEFKVDSRDGTAKLLEINSRFWGTLDLAIQAGVDFPSLTCKLALEGDVEPVFDYQVGMKYRWLFPFELVHALQSKKRLKALAEFVRFDKDARYDLWLSDPFPNLVGLLRPRADLTCPAGE
jgi:predicted ATP-grasp superfamily ATP-dependent carboligase